MSRCGNDNELGAAPQGGFLPFPCFLRHDARMDTTRYHAACDRIGQLLNAYGQEHNHDRTPAFQYHRPSSDVIDRAVASALKQFDFRALVRERVLGALCDALEGEHELQPIRLIFQGLRELVEDEADPGE